MCWQPDAPQARPMLAAGPTPPPTPKTASPSAGGRPNGPNASSDWFPCLSAWYPTGYLNNPSAFYAVVDPYVWGVCHSGEWIPYNNSYAWVAGTKRHHHCPVRWVKLGHAPVPIPIHPRDVKGKPPINRVALQPVKGKDGGIRVTPIKVEPGKTLQVLKDPPKDFRHPSQPVLARTDAPRMQMLAMHDNAKAGITAHTAIPMTFNHQQGFVTSHQVMQGGRPVAVSVPVGRMGGTGGFSGGMPSTGFSGHSGGGVGFGAVSHGGGSYGGGASHGGGGSVAGSGGGGGGSHGGGGTVSTTSVSATPSASSTAAPASPHK